MTHARFLSPFPLPQRQSSSLVDGLLSPDESKYRWNEGVLPAFFSSTLKVINSDKKIRLAGFQTSKETLSGCV
ncbi:hypothetical protein V5O48_015633, partial [Marasmius crinis-equi]